MGVVAQGEVLSEMYAHVPEGGDHLHGCSSNVQGRGGLSAPPEIHNHLFGFPHIDAEVVFSAPTLQVFHLLSVCGLIIVIDTSHHCCVIRKLHNVTAGVFCRAVICQQSEQEGAQHAALRGAGAEGDGGGGDVVDCVSLLRSPGPR